MVCEEAYDVKKIKSEIRKGLKPLMRALRTHNLYPIEACARELAEAVKKLYKSSDGDSVEVLFEDMKNNVQEEEDKDIPVDIVDDDAEDDSDKPDNIIETGTDIKS